MGKMESQRPQIPTCPWDRLGSRGWVGRDSWPIQRAKKERTMKVLPLKLGVGAMKAVRDVEAPELATAGSCHYPWACRGGGRELLPRCREGGGTGLPGRNPGLQERSRSAGNPRTGAGELGYQTPASPSPPSPQPLPGPPIGLTPVAARGPGSRPSAHRVGAQGGERIWQQTEPIQGASATQPESGLEQGLPVVEARASLHTPTPPCYQCLCFPLPWGGVGVGAGVGRGAGSGLLTLPSAPPTAVPPPLHTKCGGPVGPWGWGLFFFLPCSCSFWSHKRATERKN